MGRELTLGISMRLLLLLDGRSSEGRSLACSSVSVYLLFVEILDFLRILSATSLVPILFLRRLVCPKAATSFA
jgi:hypothetical protein